ncbi:hypothetical protein [Streptomyces sp. NPDC050738]|uniref:hypothetical protein n=1 Tax=Streptomyces sp. NPDC050738 TaxID=3154744 RepID=UPI003416741D
MTEPLEFGTMLAWLLDHRALDARELAERAESTADDIRAVCAGSIPGPELLRQLAPALGFHAADLFILAGLQVPDDLAPLDAAAGRWGARIVMDAVHLPSAGRQEVLRLIRSLPREKRSSPFSPHQYGNLSDRPGGRLIRMASYRNLGRSDLAHVLAVLTPSYLSASTYTVIGADRKELTPRLVADFASLLGVDARELAGLTGVALSESPAPAAQEAVDAAALLWAARGLSTTQAESVAELAHSLRDEPRNEYRLNVTAW